MFEIDYTNDYIRSVITDELVAFPGVTKTMLNQRLKIRLRKSVTNVIDQMIEDEEIIIHWKNIPNLVRPVSVMYLPSQLLRVDDSMVDSYIEYGEDIRPHDNRY